MKTNTALPRVAIITGATLGIGRAAAETFAKNGWAIGIIARDEKRVRELESFLHAQGCPALGIAADVADATAIDAAANRFETELGPIHTWVNNAMVSVLSPALELKPEEFQRVTEVTYLGAVYGTLAALRHMRTRNTGTIIQINSVLGRRPFPLQSAYAAAKGALRNFTDSLRGELRHENIKVQLTNIYLPTVNTPQFDGMMRNRSGHKQKAPPPVFSPYLPANAILFAATHPRRDIWVGRTNVQVALLNIFPTLADQIAAKGWDSQLKQQTTPENEGNLFQPGSGPSRVQGPFTKQEQNSRHEFWTSRQRNAVLAGLGAAASGLCAVGAIALFKLARHQF